MLQIIISSNEITVIGGILGGVVGGIIGYVVGLSLERYKNENLNRKWHYDQLKEKCLEPLYKNLIFIYVNNFKFTHHSRYPNIQPLTKRVNNPTASGGASEL